jgi:type III pantothenate kinase
MTLAIDIGNSSAKLGVFEGSTKKHVHNTEEISAPLLDKLVPEYGISRVIYSSVRGSSDMLTAYCKSHRLDLSTLSYKTKIPLKIEYSTPQTLGSDRIAGIVGAYNKYPDNNVLLIDAGTAVTYDVLSADGIYKGGNISPGLSMRFRSLNAFTGKLPLISPDIKYDIIGNSTENAIRSGVQQGLIFEINEYIRTFENLFEGLKIVITGGDGELLSGLINQAADYSPDLVLEGLNYIANYNA